MANGPFKLKGWSPFTKTSPAKDDPHTTTEEHAAHEKTSEEITVLAAERQKREVMDKLVRKAMAQGLSEESAKKAALAEYKRNI